MKSSNFEFKTSDGYSIFTYLWEPEEEVTKKGIIQVIHGLAEHAKRYERFAKEATDNGFIVVADDHRGHGKTAKNDDELGFLGEKDGFNMMVEDEYLLTKIMKEKYPFLPYFMLGHSMGSFILQRFIEIYGKELNGAILSGSAGPNPILLYPGNLIARIAMLINGPRKKSKFLNSLSFGNYNAAFKPNRTEFDWLSRDEQEVDKYVADPLCGFVCSTSLYYFLTKGMIQMHKKHNLNLIPKSLPVIILSGSMDPVGAKTVSDLYKIYLKLGLNDVEIKLYENARHEILNEINREEVTRDILNWIKRHL
ncbi:MAG: lysophospholipase [Exilispira sp.]